MHNNGHLLHEDQACNHQHSSLNQIAENLQENLKKTSPQKFKTFILYLFISIITSFNETFSH